MLIAGELRDVQGILEHLVLCLWFLCIFQIVVKNQVYLKIIIRTISEYHFVTIWLLVSVSEVIKIWIYINFVGKNTPVSFNLFYFKLVKIYL